MPGDQTDLDRLGSTIVGDQGRRGVSNPSSADLDSRTNRIPKVKRGGRKIILMDEDNFKDSIEFDYNPTELPFSKIINWNDKTIIGGEEALEFKGIGRREFTWQFFLTDFGYHRAKTSEETVLAKLNWLEDKTTVTRKMADGEVVDIPHILFLLKGDETIRVVILKIDGKQILLKKNFDPDRAIVNVTFRRVRRAFSQGGRIGRLKRRTF